MSFRHPVASFAMLALLLLRVGPSPVMTDCTSAHHDGARPGGTTALQHDGHGADAAPSQEHAPGCDHPDGNGLPHNMTECAQMSGCASGVAMLAASEVILPLASGLGAHIPMAARVHPRSTRPTIPPPRS